MPQLPKRTSPAKFGSRRASSSAVPTVYRGVRFLSKLEAGWAQSMDGLLLRWDYEPVTIRLPSRVLYKPDFYLPTLDAFLEVKGGHLERIQKTVEFARSGKRKVYIGLSDFGGVNTKFQDSAGNTHPTFPMYIVNRAGLFEPVHPFTCVGCGVTSFPTVFVSDQPTEHKPGCGLLGSLRPPSAGAASRNLWPRSKSAPRHPRVPVEYSALQWPTHPIKP